MKTPGATSPSLSTQNPAPEASASVPGGAPVSNADQLLEWLYATLQGSRRETKRDLEQWSSLSGSPLEQARGGQAIAERVAQRTTTEKLLFDTIEKITSSETKNARDVWKSG